MKNTAKHKCYYLVQPTNTREKLSIALFCKFGKVKMTAPSPTPAYYTRAVLVPPPPPLRKHAESQQNDGNMGSCA